MENVTLTDDKVVTATILTAIATGLIVVFLVLFLEPLRQKYIKN